MGYDLSRAAVVFVSVFAVLLAASLFPASGFGAYPASVGDGASGPANPTGVDDPGPDGSAVTDAPGSSTVTDSTGDSTGGSDGKNRTTVEPNTSTATETTTETQTEASADDDRNAGGGNGVDFAKYAAQVMLLFVVLALGGIVLLLVGTVERTETSGDFDGWRVDLPGLPTFHVGASFLAVPQMTMSFLVGAAASAPRILDGIGATANGFLSGVGAAASDLGSAMGTMFVAVPGALASGFVSIPRGLSGGLGSLTLGFSGLLGGASSRNWLGRRSDKPDDPRDGAAPASDDDAPEEIGPMSIEDAWSAMVEELPLRRSDARTPAEYARSAVENGFPADPVRNLTDVFRQVRYGRYPESADRRRVARDAIEQIRQRLEGDG